LLVRLWLRYDLTALEFAASTAQQYAAALDQVEWADKLGFEGVIISEHHGTEGGYCPSPFVAAAGMAARSRQIKIQIGAVVLPLLDPLRVAEDTVVLDNLSGGRAELVIAAGYVASEFAMFARALHDRARLLDEGIETLRECFTGEPFDYRGRRVHVTPVPAQKGGPPIYVGGAVPASARRAARLGDGFFPTIYTPDLAQLYRDECLRLGKEPGPIFDITGPLYVHVSHDPEMVWDRIAPHVLHEMNQYGKWASEADANNPFQPVDDITALRESGLYRVVTPDECVELLLEQDAAGRLVMLSPLVGGLPPDIAWENLELFASEVIPRLPGATSNRSGS
jgi:alkanesulfonate monooxygenase SsuD/methylene tetrahydromethanopterin reductase-like flavin-dependent oxidoreductase (luciferase family)